MIFQKGNKPVFVKLSPFKETNEHTDSKKKKAQEITHQSGGAPHKAQRAQRTKIHMSGSSLRVSEQLGLGASVSQEAPTACDQKRLPEEDLTNDVRPSHFRN